MDPSLGLGHADIVDCFRGPEVEHNVRQWLNGAEPTRNTNQLAENIIKRFKNIIEIARKSDPPVPAKGSVNPGYNPQLDKKRPETMMDYLRLVFPSDMFAMVNHKHMSPEIIVYCS